MPFNLEKLDKVNSASLVALSEPADKRLKNKDYQREADLKQKQKISPTVF